MTAERGVRSAVMGTAPGNTRQSPMPDPERIVDVSVGFLTALGVSTIHALAVAEIAARNVARDIADMSDADVTLLGVVALIARSRRAALSPSSNDRTENTHADGSRG